MFVILEIIPKALPLFLHISYKVLPAFYKRSTRFLDSMSTILLMVFLTCHPRMFMLYLHCTSILLCFSGSVRPGFLQRKPHFQRQDPGNSHKGALDFFAYPYLYSFIP